MSESDGLFHVTEPRIIIPAGGATVNIGDHAFEIGSQRNLGNRIGVNNLGDLVCNVVCELCVALLGDVKPGDNMHYYTAIGNE